MGCTQGHDLAYGALVYQPFLIWTSSKGPYKYSPFILLPQLDLSSLFILSFLYYTRPLFTVMYGYRVI
jgi:hypothetical protein